MNHRLRSLAALCIAFTLCHAAIPQHTVPPPPKPADSGPSLAATMQFIQDQLNGVGVVNFVDYYHDTATGQDWSWQHSIETDHVIADAASCGISFHIREAQNGEVLQPGYNGAFIQDKDEAIQLRSVGKLIVMTYSDQMNQWGSKGGHPSWSHSTSTTIFSLVPSFPTNSDSANAPFFLFYDQDSADRVAKALTHAVELCGGGNKDAF
jgi:hypothetical protein